MKGEISSVNIEKTENGVIVTISTKVEDKKGYDGFRYESKRYNGRPELLDEILEDVGGSEATDVEEKEPKKLNPKTFLDKKKS